MEKEYLNQSEFCSLEVMLGSDLARSPYPPGLYGRAYRTGLMLREKYGWWALCHLSRTGVRGNLVAIEGRLSVYSQQTGILEHESGFLNQT
jgi:hypothetical protein